MATKRTAAPDQDAIALLLADHKTVKGLFSQFDELKENGSDQEKSDVVAQICNELKVHAAIEDHDEVAAQALDLGLHRGSRALPDGHHGDHRRDSDDDAQDGQHGAHAISLEGPQGHPEDHGEVHGVKAPSPLRMRPPRD